jgi:hypothetical protein
MNVQLLWNKSSVSSRTCSVLITWYILRKSDIPRRSRVHHVLLVLLLFWNSSSRKPSSMYSSSTVIFSSHIVWCSWACRHSPQTTPFLINIVGIRWFVFIERAVAVRTSSCSPLSSLPCLAHVQRFDSRESGFLVGCNSHLSSTDSDNELIVDKVFLINKEPEATSR